MTRPAEVPVPDVVVRIDSDAAILEARAVGRNLARRAGFGVIDLAMIATAISELSRNSLRFASGGRLHVRIVESGGRTGLTVAMSDDGPGIADVALALQDGFSTSGHLGLGLPGVRRLMDEFDIATSTRGTTVTATKWRR